MSIIFSIDMEFEFLWWTFKKDAMCKKSRKLIFKSFLELFLYWITESPDYFQWGSLQRSSSLLRQLITDIRQLITDIQRGSCLRQLPQHLQNMNKGCKISAHKSGNFSLKQTKPNEMFKD